jgi:hypothetical protein
VEKRRILEEADGCTELGALGALLRREGIYSSYLTAWRRQRDRGEIAGLAPKKRGPKRQATDERDQKIAELQRENARLMARAEKAEAIVEIQKKLGQLFGVQMPEATRRGNPDARGRGTRTSRRRSGDVYGASVCAGHILPTATAEGTGLPAICETATCTLNRRTRTGIEGATRAALL